MVGLSEIELSTYLSREADKLSLVNREEILNVVNQPG
jgi:hypothetical protein